MTTKEDLLKIVSKANKEQLWDMIYGFEQIGFYREDKRQRRKFVIECINNCYTTDKTLYSELHDYDSIRMEKYVLKAMNN